MVNRSRRHLPAPQTLSIFALLFVSFAPGVRAQTGPDVAMPKNMKVATRVLAPFVIKQDDRLTGFSIDLWEQISADLGVKTEYVIEPAVTDLLQAVKTKKADIGVAAISITSQRDQQFDFSQPIFESGLQILVRDTPQKSSPFPTLHTLFQPALFQLFGVMLLLILIPAHIVWLVERKHPMGMIDDHRYFPGIFHAAWWALSTLATQADQMPRSAVGRFIAVIWMFTGVGFVAYFTAALTAQQTVEQLQGTIQSVSDLAGKTVATTKGSTSAEYMRKRGVQVREVPDIGAAYTMLETEQVDAVVADSPVLLYYSSHEGRGKVKVVGSVFHKENYGIVIPQNSPYRRPINSALLRLRENGTYDNLYDEWFENK